ncbi:MAG: hypothetical protein J0H68_08000 [Sphingobacteriia bacterium]|nr:hypothetical protein [Sphingobacteriia bacterium]
MYDSPRTKLIKEVFDDETNFAKFRDFCIAFETKQGLNKIFERELRDYYNEFKKEIRKNFKSFCDAYEIDFHNNELTSVIKELFIASINSFAQDFSQNRIIENKLHYKIIIRKIAENTVSGIKADKLINKLLIVSNNINKYDQIVSKNLTNETVNSNVKETKNKVSGAV